MELTAMDLACLVYRVSRDAVLAAAFRPDGGFAVVLDQGIRGAPKFVMTPHATNEAVARHAERKSENVQETRAPAAEGKRSARHKKAERKGE